ncbi:MAG: DNA repair protein RadA [Magnetococcales bacterium]|nr:DNA repair protein RadA [Magnetococcales bacterium]MBF0114986.1 DNA repair protein RadA [Magnetococcales bacterium]
MAKEKSSFVCSECGAESIQWEGRCASCGSWNSLQRFQPAPLSRNSTAPHFLTESHPVDLAQVVADPRPRLTLDNQELRRVLGGGLTQGSAVLLAGDPGIGKSTLLMATMADFARRTSVLYVSGEESIQQLKQRSMRLEMMEKGLLVLMENRLEAVIHNAEQLKPTVLVVDSVQTLASDRTGSAAGSVSQVRECAAQLIQLAKQRNMALFLVGHVTKDGQIAGPRVLEHMVDTVLYFEGERGHNYRILRAVKNRFGPANEIGVFEMSESGLREVANPSELFLSERVAGAAGSVVYAGLEGTRPLLLEIQALVAPTPLPQPRRTTLGLDPNRLAMLTAVMEKRLGLGLFNHDIFLNVAGGFRVTEPAVDLAVCAALVASHRNLSLDANLVILGEVGLSGEVRSVSHVATRLKEAAKLGFSRCIVPEKALRSLPEGLPIALDPVKSVEEMVRRLLAP